MKKRGLLEEWKAVLVEKYHNEEIHNGAGVVEYPEGYIASGVTNQFQLIKLSVFFQI